MKKVSKEELYNFIAHLDVVLDIKGEYPYKTVFRYRHGGVAGVEDRDGNCYLVDDENQHLEEKQ